MREGKKTSQKAERVLYIYLSNGPGRHRDVYMRSGH